MYENNYIGNNKICMLLIIINYLTDTFVKLNKKL